MNRSPWVARMIGTVGPERESHVKKTRALFLQFRRLATRSGWMTLVLIVIGAIASEAAPFAYVANLADGISVVDTATNEVVATVGVGAGPQGVAITPNGAFAYVTNFTSNDVSVIKTATNTVTATVEVGGGPLGVAITPNGAFAYVTVFGNLCVGGGVWVIDTATNAVVATVPLVGCTTGVAITPNGAFAYATNNTSDTVSVIDTTTNSVMLTVPVGGNPYGVAITPDGASAYVTHSGFSGASANSVSVIDTAANSVAATVSVGAVPRGVAITPDGAFAYVTNNISNTVSVVATATNTVVATVPVGGGPWGVAITPDGAFAYVTNSNSDTVSVIGTATNTVLATVAVPSGAGPRWIAIVAAVDTTPPDTSVLSGPAEASLTNSTQVTFTFSGTDDQTESTALAFTCSLDGAAFAACMSPQTYAGLTDGQHTFAVRAVDEAGNTDPTLATRTWTVDTTPPMLFLSVTPQVLWPPSHQMVEVSVTAAASDDASVVLISVTSSEPDNSGRDGDTSDDIQGADVGTRDTSILVRAERSGSGEGRVYTLTYQATDAAGNSTTASATVTVPINHSQAAGAPAASVPRR